MVEIPEISLAGCRGGESGGIELAASGVRKALEEVGFFFISDTGIDASVVDQIYAAAAVVCGVDQAEKDANLVDYPERLGFLRLAQSRSRYSKIAGEDPKPNLHEAFLIKDESLGRNRWPSQVEAGMRKALLSYFDAMFELCLDLLRVLSVSLGERPGFFAPYFEGSECGTLRLNHFPPLEAEEDQWGLAAHTDANFLTVLPPNPVSGLAIRPAEQDWTAAPHIDDALLVNSGDLLKRWTNDHYLSTEHRVSPRTAGDRYSIPFFFGPDLEAIIAPMERFLPDGEESRYPIESFGEIEMRFYQTNYVHRPEQVVSGGGSDR